MPYATVADRLEYLRSQIEAERISYLEIAELQEYAAQGKIDPSDAELLEWAGVSEEAYASGDYRTFVAEDCPACGDPFGTPNCDGIVR